MDLIYRGEIVGTSRIAFLTWRIWMGKFLPAKTPASEEFCRAAEALDARTAFQKLSVGLTP